MMQKPQLRPLSKGVCLAIIVIQLFDIAIHAASNQLEPLRVTSNAIILIWLIAVIAGKISGKFVPVAGGSIGAYLLLNMLFLALEGVTNPNQGGELRGMLFLLVIVTVGLSSLLTVLRKQ